MRVSVLRVVLVVGSSFFCKSALADAVPPPPERCPPGYVAVTSHRGPECLLKSSTKCRPGVCAERSPPRPRMNAANEARAYGTGDPVVAAPPAEAPTPVAIESATPSESPKPSGSAKAAETAEPGSGAGASGGCRKGCTVSSTPDAAAWLIVPLLAVTALFRRRASATVRA